MSEFNASVKRFYTEVDLHATFSSFEKALAWIEQKKQVYTAPLYRFQIKQHQKGFGYRLLYTEMVKNYQENVYAQVCDCFGGPMFERLGDSTGKLLKIAFVTDKNQAPACDLLVHIAHGNKQYIGDKEMHFDPETIDWTDIEYLVYTWINLN